MIRLVHLSDTHLTPQGQLLHGRIDTWQRTVAALSAATHFAPDAVVVTGDIAERGAAVHERAARLFARAEAQLGCPVITLPGNHDPSGSIDTRFNLRRTATGPHPANTVHRVQGLRIITLDSGGYGQPEGRLDEEQLHWLGAELATPAERGTLLALHHPPVEAIAPALARRGLVNAHQLARLLPGSDVRGILCGHYHLPASGHLAGVPVWMGPAVSYNHNLFAPADTLQGLDSSWLSIIQLGQTMDAVPVPVTSPAAVFTRVVDQRLPAAQPA